MKPSLLNNKPSVWLEFTPLAKASSSINLGQGFPDWAPPSFVQEAASQAVLGDEFSTYARSAGQLKLVCEIAKQYEPRLQQSLNPTKQILVTVGASEGLYLAISTYVQPGDEVVVLEPAFDLYFGALQSRNAKIVRVELNAPESADSSQDLQIPWLDLKKKLSSKTKAIIINTPHNPSGKVFTRNELEELGRLLQDYPDCLVFADEVYEHLVYEPNQHTYLLSIPSLRDKTIGIYSAGKTFSTTGWKIGWLIGAEHLITPLQTMQQWIVFSVATPLQEAIAQSLSKANDPYLSYSSYYEYLRAEYTRKKDILLSALNQGGYRTLNPAGSFFIMCDSQNLPKEYQELPDHLHSFYQSHTIPIDPSTELLVDYNAARNLAFKKKIVSIPVSAFIEESHRGQGSRWLRFAFCKKDETLKKAASILIAREPE